MKSLLSNWFTNWGMAIKEGLGQTWLIVLAVVFICFALYLFQSFIRAAINKTKIVIKWGQIIFCVIFTLFAIWFITLA